ncbi:MAG: GNAT family N-acetyltransferase, partial [Nitrososphaeraceae archaeon]
RPVTQKDWMSILEIRNEPQVRLACHDTSLIIYETHSEYMKKLDSNPDAHQWVICFGDEVIGHVKIIAGELGYMLKKGFRGKGIGVKFHELVFLQAKNLGIKKLKDTIKVNNNASLKLALKTGFVSKGLIYKDGKPYAYVLEKIL